MTKRTMRVEKERAICALSSMRAAQAMLHPIVGSDGLCESPQSYNVQVADELLALAIDRMASAIEVCDAKLDNWESPNH